MKTPSRAEDVLRFWFGEDETAPATAERNRMWFAGGAEVDRQCRERFADDLERAARDELDDWAETARGRLALIVLLDQFSRNVFRGTARAFAQDEKARRLAAEGIDRGHDRELTPAQRMFFYLPFEHSEDLADQRRSERLAADVRAQASDGDREIADIFVDYAGRHARIVERFGRFPHRNAILGRASTPEEIEFLESPGSSF